MGWLCTKERPNCWYETSSRAKSFTPFSDGRFVDRFLFVCFLIHWKVPHGILVDTSVNVMLFSRRPENQQSTGNSEKNPIGKQQKKQQTIKELLISNNINYMHIQIFLNSREYGAFSLHREEEEEKAYLVCFCTTALLDFVKVANECDFCNNKRFFAVAEGVAGVLCSEWFSLSLFFSEFEVFSAFGRFLSERDRSVVDNFLQRLTNDIIWKDWNTFSL